MAEELKTKHTFLGKWLVRTFGQLLDDGRYYWNGDFYDGDSVQDNAFDNLARKYTGSGLTSAEQEMNQFNHDEAILDWQRSEQSAVNAAESQRYLRQTSLEDTVKGAQAAGINPIFALTGGAQGPSSAPQGSSHAASGSTPASGAPGLDTLLNVLFAGQRFKQTKAEIANLEAQKRNTDADTAKKQAESENLSAQTEGLRIDNKYREEFNRLRNQGQSLQNDVTFEQRNQIRAQIRNIDVNTLSQNADISLKASQELKNNVDAYIAVEMLPYQQAYTSAAAGQAQAQAAYTMVQRGIQVGLVNDGYFAAMARQMGAEADLQDFMTAVKTGDPEGKVYDGKFAQFVGRCAAGMGALLEATGVGSIVSINKSSSSSVSRSTSHSTVHME